MSRMSYVTPVAWAAVFRRCEVLRRPPRSRDGEHGEDGADGEDGRLFASAERFTSAVKLKKLGKSYLVVKGGSGAELG